MSENINELKKYECFEEHLRHELWGISLPDALLHSPPLSTEGSYSNGIYSPGPKIAISKIIGMEDTSNSLRGGKKFIRAIIETNTGIRLAIDAIEIPQPLA